MSAAFSNVTPLRPQQPTAAPPPKKEAKERMPWAKFWWNDHTSDKLLRPCSFAAQGLWMHLLGIMAEAEPYGHLLVNGRVPTPGTIAALSGTRMTDAAIGKLMVELGDAGVYSLTEDGVPFCRRMVREAAARKTAQVNGAKGGNPALLGKKSLGSQAKEERNLTKNAADTSQECSNINEVEDQEVNPQANPKANLLILRSQESKKQEDKKDSPPTPRKRGHEDGSRAYSIEFEMFWDEYPRRVGKPVAYRAWLSAMRRGVTAEAVMEALERDMRKEFAGRSEDKIPHPSTWLNRDPWECNSAFSTPLDNPSTSCNTKPAESSPADLFGG